jgi:carboxyl-terminal processing protease
LNLALALAVAHAAPVPSSATKDKSGSAPYKQDKTESNIARLVAKIMERTHYSQREFDDDVSSKFFDRYFEILDGQHLHFLQSDIAEFEPYRNRLDDLTKNSGDTKPAHLIFARMMERVGQRVDYVNELLKTEKFTFTGDDRYTPNRKDLPRPKNMDEAHKLWRQNLRFEFLQEKLSQPDTNKVKSAKGETDKKSAANKSDDSLSNTNAIAKTKKPQTPKEIIIDKITKRYANLQRTLKELSDDEVFEIYMTALARTYDPHSDYMGHSQLENFNISMKLSLFGIGALLQSEDGYCKIKELMPGPAMKSHKIQAGDRIVGVAQGDEDFVDIVGKNLNKVVELIRGEKGSKVRLEIWPADAFDPSSRKTVTLIRDVIKLEDQEAKAKVIEVQNKNETARLGVIDLPSFYGGDTDTPTGKTHKSTTEDVAKLLKKLNKENISGIILDLRRNGGGLLDEAVNLSGLFITNGPIVQVKDSDGEIITLSDSDPSVVYHGPLIVLTSHFSASASEILAGALQDYGRAMIVGDSSTFGKGTVQRVLALDRYMDQNRLSYAYDPGALKPTTAKFYRAGGSSTQLRGVIPDLQLPTVLDYAEVGEASMENPLPWDEVSTASFHKWNEVKPYLPELKKRSDQRLKTDKDYSYIREDIELFKKNLEDKSVSLNEQTRRKEKKEIDDREEARKEERKSRKPSDQKVFEVTLKNASEPGLQPYVPKTNDLASAKSDDDSSDDDALMDDKPPEIDAALSETEKVLLDYISLLPATDHALSKVE